MDEGNGGGGGILPLWVFAYLKKGGLLNESKNFARGGGWGVKILHTHRDHIICGLPPLINNDRPLRCLNIYY